MGEQIVLVQFQEVLSIEVNKEVQAFASKLQVEKIKGIKEIIPAMTNISVKYDPVQIGYEELINEIKKLIPFTEGIEEHNQKTVHIPVVFDDKYGPDLDFISETTGLTKEMIIEKLVSRTYYVYMTGFIAGLPYMGDIDQELRLPRRSTPRLKVPKGSVAIAGQMTDIYTIESPGGWHLVGWTPMEVFHYQKEPPSVLRPGDYVKYVKISTEEAGNWSETKEKEWDQKWNMYNVSSRDY